MHWQVQSPFGHKSQVDPDGCRCSLKHTGFKHTESATHFYECTLLECTIQHHVLCIMDNTINLICFQRPGMQCFYYTYNNYTPSQSSRNWFNGYHPVRGSLVALASSSATIISYSRSINEIPSCKVIHCEQVCLQRSLRRGISAH